MNGKCSGLSVTDKLFSCIGRKTLRSYHGDELRLDELELGHDVLEDVSLSLDRSRFAWKKLWSTTQFSNIIFSTFRVRPT